MSQPLYEKPGNLEKSERLALCAVVAVVVVCFFLGLGALPLVGKDEPRYAEVAREMYVSGDWITPRLAGHTWFEKPALPYWLMAAGYAVFGVSELGARFGAALLGVLGVLTVFLAARRAWGAPSAIYSALALATSALWLAFARAASFDMPLAATMAVALGSFFAFDTSEGRARTLWASSFGFWTGASMLAKGLAGPVLLGGIVVPYLLVVGTWRRLRPIDVAAAAACAVATAATWYWPVYARNGWAFVDEFFVNHHFNRYLTNQFRHPAPWYFYLLIVAGGLLPWTFVLAGGGARLARVLRRRPADTGERLVWLAALWVLVPLAFFSLSTSKLPGYILPVFPALALLVGWTVGGFERNGAGRWPLLAGALSVVALALGLVGYLGRVPGVDRAHLVTFAIPVACALVAVRRGQSTSRAAWAIAAGVVAAVIVLRAQFFPNVAAAESFHALSLAAARSLRDGEVVIPFRFTEFGPVYYTEGRMAVDQHGDIVIADSVEQVIAAAAAAPSRSTLCVTSPEGLEQLIADGRLAVEPLERSPKELRRRSVLVRASLVTP